MGAGGCWGGPRGAEILQGHWVGGGSPWGEAPRGEQEGQGSWGWGRFWGLAAMGWKRSAGLASGWGRGCALGLLLFNLGTPNASFLWGVSSRKQLLSRRAQIRADSQQ